VSCPIAWQDLVVVGCDNNGGMSAKCVKTEFYVTYSMYQSIVTPSSDTLKNQLRNNHQMRTHGENLTLKG